MLGCELPILHTVPDPHHNSKAQAEVTQTWVWVWAIAPPSKPAIAPAPPPPHHPGEQCHSSPSLPNLCFYWRKSYASSMCSTSSGFRFQERITHQCVGPRGHRPSVRNATWMNRAWAEDWREWVTRVWHPRRPAPRCKDSSRPKQCMYTYVYVYIYIYTYIYI